MISHKNEANAVGGKTARACDNCIRKRARWYCTADDAFLCQSCDASVHSANPLARRHERVRLKTATSSQKHLAELLPHKKSSFSSSSSSWHRGFTKKPRTPRSGNPALRRASKSDQSAQNPFPLVPDVGGDETSNEESEEHLLYRVPAYDPFVAEISQSKGADMTPFSRETGALAVTDGGGSDDNRTKALCVDIENLHGFLPSDADLAEFAADVESLLGRGLENESFGIEGLGLIECKEGDDHNDDSTESSLGGTQMIKLEEEEGVVVEPVGARHGGDVEIDVSKETFELNFDYGSPISSGEEEGKAVVELEEKKVENSGGGEGVNHMEEKKKTRKEIFLALDYEAVIAAWANQGSPWTSSDRPDFSADDSWPDFMGMYGAEFQNPLYGGEVGLYGAHMGLADAGREAKVSRYREKRRTRLFSKKIRYEVRKLNAEKRPRMKGRFVKRASFAPTTFPSLSK